MDCHYSHDVYAFPLPLHPTRAKSYKPGRRTIFVSLLLSFLLLISQIFSSLHLRTPSKISIHSISQSMVRQALEVPVLPNCMKSFLGVKLLPRQPTGFCHPIPPNRGICSLIQDMFFNSKPFKCEEEEVKFCNTVGGLPMCHVPAECEGRVLNIGTFNSIIGETIWQVISPLSIQHTISTIVKNVEFNGFVFLNCSEDKKSMDENHYEYLNDISSTNNIVQETIAQVYLYPLPKSHFEVELNGRKARAKSLSFNIIMFQSLSRNHFYRSLPLSIEAMEKFKERNEKSVLDFHFVQSIGGTNIDNLRLLFNGILPEPSSNGMSIVNLASDLGTIFLPLKKKGYTTLWMEDQCRIKNEGLQEYLNLTDEKIKKRGNWKRLIARTKMAGIDSLGFHMALCDILSNTKASSTPECINGRFHHDFLLNFLSNYHEQSLKSQRPFLTFTMTDIAQEASGLRIQSLDQALLNHLTLGSKLESTITILMSDHGIVSGDFMEATLEARVESSSPFLFLLVPHKAQRIVGDVNMRILKDNERRLISILDLHETLLGLTGIENKNRDKSFKTKFVVPRGLLSNISPRRTCQDMPLIKPNVCICRGFDLSVEISPLHNVLSDFSIGVVNNILLHEQTRAGYKGFEKCHMLRIVKIINVKESLNAADVVIYAINAIVGPWLGAPYMNEPFKFVVEVGAGKPQIRLISYSNSEAIDQRINCDLHLPNGICICSLLPTHSEKNPGLLDSLFSLNFIYGWLFRDTEKYSDSNGAIQMFMQNKPSEMNITREGIFPYTSQACLFIIRQEYHGNLLLYAVNKCYGMHKISLRVRSKNSYISDDYDSNHLVQSEEIKFLIASVKSNPLGKSSFLYDVQVV